MTLPAPFSIPDRLKGKLCTPDEAASLIRDDTVVAASGYTSAGTPKATLLALADRGRAGEIHQIDLITAAQLPVEVENALAAAGILRRRAPFTVSDLVRKMANAQQLHYVEVAMSKMPRLFAAGSFGRPHTAVIEILGLGADGCAIPTTSVGINQLMCEMADQIILEVNHFPPDPPSPPQRAFTGRMKHYGNAKAFLAVSVPR